MVLSSGAGFQMIKSCHRPWQPVGWMSHMGGISHALPPPCQGGLAPQSTELLGMVVPGICPFGGVTGITILPSFTLHRKGAFFAILLAEWLRDSKLRSATFYPKVRTQKQWTVSAVFRRLSVSRTTSLASHTGLHLHAWLHFIAAHIISETHCHCFSRAKQDTLPP